MSAFVMKMYGEGESVNSQPERGDSAVPLVVLLSVTSRDGILLVFWGNFGFILFYVVNPRGVKS